MLGTGPVGVAGGAAAVAGAAGGGALAASEAGCTGCAFALDVGVFVVRLAALSGGATRPASAVIGAAGCDFVLAVRRGALAVGIAVSAGTTALAVCWVWSPADGFVLATAADRRAPGGCRVKGRSAGGGALAAASWRIRLGMVGGGPSASMTLSFTITSGSVDPPIRAVCAAAGGTDAASSEPIAIAARQAASRRVADAENLLMTQPRFSLTGRWRPLTQTFSQNTVPPPMPLLRDFASKFRELRRPSWRP